MTSYNQESRGGFPTITRWVKRLLILNIALWGFTYLLSFPQGGTWEAAFFRVFGVYPPLFFSQPWFAFWQPFSYMFLHGGPMHLFWNMLVLFFFGVFLESQRGSREFLRIYLMGGVAGGLAFLVWDGWIMPSYSPCVGASGAIMAIMVSTAVLYPRMTVWFFGMVPIQLWILAAVFVGIDVIRILEAMKGGGAGNVAASAHLGGALTGFLMIRYPAYFARIGDGIANLPERWRARRAQRQAEDLRSRRERVDELLDKINREGIGSLTKSEQEFLKRSSKLYDRR